MTPFSWLIAVTWSRWLLRLFRRLGGLGLFLLGICDSSFLFLPLGNDFLLVALTSRQPGNWLYYAVMATWGSVVGCFLTDLVARKGGEEGLVRFMPPEKVRKLKDRISRKAGWAVATAALLPPPFPFTAVVAAAAALQYPRKKLFAEIFCGRLLRFSAEALFAVYFGRRLLRLLRSEAVEYLVYGFLLVAVIGTFVTLRKWLAGGRRQPTPAAP